MNDKIVCSSNVKDCDVACKVYAHFIPFYSCFNISKGAPTHLL